MWNFNRALHVQSVLITVQRKWKQPPIQLCIKFRHSCYSLATLSRVAPTCSGSTAFLYDTADLMYLFAYCLSPPLETQNLFSLCIIVPCCTWHRVKQYVYSKCSIKVDTLIEWVSQAVCLVLQEMSSILLLNTGTSSSLDRPTSPPN